MEFVRKVVNGIELQGIIDMPQSLINQKVEILVFPIDVEKKINNKKKKSLSGFLSKYANKDLIVKEEQAWYEEARE